MTKTGQVIASGTLTDNTHGATQVPVESAMVKTTVSTVADPHSGSVPIAIPETPAASGVIASGFVVRAVPGMHTVAVRLDAQELAEQERVRRLNESIRRSTQG